MNTVQMFLLVGATIMLTEAAQAQVIISKHATQNMTCSGGVCSPTAAKAYLNVYDLERQLGEGNLTVQTDTTAPDIVSNAAFSSGGSYNLTLEAAGNITVGRAISINGPGGLDLIYNATGAGGLLSFGKRGSVSFSNVSTPLSINGQSYTLVGNVKTLARYVADNPSGNFALAASYNARNDGKYPQSPIPTTFQGNFEGLGNTISHLTVESSGQDQVGGLFQQMAANSYVGNLILNAVTLQLGDDTVAGGLVAENNGTLFQDSFTGNITVSESSCLFVWLGGLAGGNNGTISYSFAAGRINASNACGFIGGLVGVNDGQFNKLAEIDHSYATDSVTDSTNGGGPTIGGLVGGNFASVTWAFSTGAVTSGGANNDPVLLGGLIGDNNGNGSISNSSASGAVTDTADTDVLAGGAIGWNSYGAVDTTVATGAVSGGPNCECGGAVGQANEPVANTVAYGTITGGSGSTVGGFVGVDGSNGSGGLFSNDGWDMTTSGISDPSLGAGNVPNDPGITGFD